MHNDNRLTEEDEGKHVMNAHGDEIGLVVAVEHGTAHVEPDPGITDSIRSKLGWSNTETEGTYELDEAHVESVTDDMVMLDR